jgi:hypothetical protein
MVLWVVAALCISFMAIRNQTPDDRWIPFSDQASHLNAAMSIWHDGDLEFTRTDLERYQAMFPGANGPRGTFLKQGSEGQLFYAKPALYALASAPFYGVFGTAGFIILNLCMVWTMAILTQRIARPVLGEALSYPAAFSLFFIGPSIAWATMIHPDLLIALVLFLGGYLLLTQNRYPWLILAGWLLGFALYEKPTFVILIPFLLLASGHFRLKPLCTVALAIVGGWASMTLINLGQDSNALAYQGARFVLRGSPFPFEPGWTGPNFTGLKHIFDPLLIIKAVFSNVAVMPQKLVDLFIGRQTGLLLYFPVIVAFMVAAVYPLNHRALVLVAGLLAYVLFNALVFPTNGFGGTQTYGSRYFLQAMPMAVLALIPLAGTRFQHSSSSRAVPMTLATITICMAFGLQYKTWPPNHATVYDPSDFLLTRPATYFPLEESLLPSLPIYEYGFSWPSPAGNGSLFLTDGFRNGSVQYQDAVAKGSATVFLEAGRGAMAPLSIRSTVAADARVWFNGETLWSGPLMPGQSQRLDLSNVELKPGVFDLLSSKRVSWGTLTFELKARNEESAPSFATLTHFRDRMPVPVAKSVPIPPSQFLSQGIETSFGWGAVEGWGQWTIGPYAELDLVLSEPAQSHDFLILNAQGFLSGPHSKQDVSVFVNGKHVQQLTFSARRAHSFKLPLQAQAGETSLRIGFQMKNPVAPAELGRSFDSRKLGLGLASIEVSAERAAEKKQP